MEYSLNTMPFLRTWVNSRYSASLRQRRMLIGSFVVRTNFSGLNEALFLLSGGEPLVDLKSRKKFLHRRSCAMDYRRIPAMTVESATTKGPQATYEGCVISG